MNNLSDSEIIGIAKTFTKGILNGESADSMCFVVCAPLEAYLSCCGVDCKLTEGDIQIDSCEWHHFWLVLKDGRIIDPTASQFIKPDGKKLRNIWLKTAPSYYHPYTKKDFDNKIKEALKVFNK